MFKDWSKQSNWARFLTVVNLLCTVAAAVLCVLYLLDIAQLLIYVMPLMGVVMLTQSGLYWKKDRGIAIFSLFAGLCLLGFFGYNYLL